MFSFGYMPQYTHSVQLIAFCFVITLTSLLTHSAKLYTGGGNTTIPLSFPPHRISVIAPELLRISLVSAPWQVLGLQATVCEVIEPTLPFSPVSSVRWGRDRGRVVLMGNTDLGINIHTAALSGVCVCCQRGGAGGGGGYASTLKAMVRVIRTMLVGVRPC